MPVADFAQGVQTPFFPMVRHENDNWPPARRTPAQSVAATAAPATKTASADPSDGKSFWDNVLDVINPLEHFPIVGTIYRNITGDKPGDLEKVAGDTLYGGPLGLASSLADVAFEKITGKSFEDTVLGFFEGGDKTTALASSTTKPLNALPSRTTADAPPISPAKTVSAPASGAPTSIVPGAKSANADIKQAAQADSDANTQALLASINQSGMDSDLGMRALFAYQKSMGLSPQAPSGPSAAP